MFGEDVNDGDCCGGDLKKSARITGGAIMGGALALAATIEVGGLATGPGVVVTVPVGGVVALGGLIGGGAVMLYDHITNSSSSESKSLPQSKSEKSHGNKLNDKPAERYTLRDKGTGEVKKHGETTRGEDKFGKGNQKRYGKKELK